MQKDESSAIRACQTGDPEKFSFLYDRYIRKIYDFIYYKTHHKETAEDLTSRSFLKALENIGKFDHKKGTFQAWLYRIARNTVIDHYRTAKNDVNIEDVWDLHDSSDVIKDIDARRQLEEIKKYLGRLKTEQRDIMIMRIWQGMSYTEIAEITGKSEAGCKMMFSRVISRLRGDMPLTAFLAFLLFR